MSERKTCEYWLSGCFMIEDIAKESTIEGKKLMDKFCRTGEKPVECPAYQLNEKLYKQPYEPFDPTRVQDPYLRILLQIISTGARIALHEWGRGKAKETGSYQVVKKEMKDIATKE